MSVFEFNLTLKQRSYLHKRKFKILLRCYCFLFYLILIFQETSPKNSYDFYPLCDLNPHRLPTTRALHGSSSRFSVQSCPRSGFRLHNRLSRGHLTTSPTKIRRMSTDTETPTPEATNCSVDSLIALHVQNGNTRCDEEVLKTSPEYFLGSVVHDTLRGEGLIEEYRVYRKDDDEEITCIVKFGDKLNGHPGIVHGGIISTSIDNTFGWLFTALDYPPSFTANLNINFR